MLLFDFVVLGTPISVQAAGRTKARWKKIVAKEAKAAWPGGSPLKNGSLKLTLVYYYDSAALDTDNMIKPIQDSLIGIAYDDDSQITDVSASKRDLNGSYRVRGMSPRLAHGFASNRDFVHVRIEDAPDPQELV